MASSKNSFVWLCVSVARMILHSREQRRQLMFLGMLAAMVQVFLGVVVFESYLMRRPVLFAAFWIVCFAVVLFILLLAAYDILAVRREGKARERELQKSLAEAVGQSGVREKDTVDDETSNVPGSRAGDAASGARRDE